MSARTLSHRPLAALLAMTMLVTGCSITGGTLGGRQRCWDETEQRIPSLMKGTLRLDPNGWRLDTPEGEVLQLAFDARHQVVMEGDPWRVVDGGGREVAASGDLVTLFGGLGADAILVVCGVEDRIDRG